MLNYVVIPFVLFAAVYVMAAYGIARTFVLVYMPAIIFFSLAKPIPIPGLPNLTVMSSVGYVVLAMSMYRWQEIARVKWHAVDVIVVLMMIAPIISVFLNNTLWDAVSRVGDQFFSWALPYFMARIAFQDPVARKMLVQVLCVCLLISGFFAAIEARLIPLVVTRTYDNLGLNAAVNSNQQVFYRFGLMRARASYGHPIDLGNCGIMFAGLVYALCHITGRRWNSGLPFWGILAGAGMVIASVSFTCFMMGAAAVGTFYLFTRPNLGRKLPPVVILLTMLLYIAVMAFLLEYPASKDNPPRDNKLQESIWIRALIAQDSERKVEAAGLFGEGQYVDVTGIGTESIDNAYILFVLQHGYFHLAGWAILAIGIGMKGKRALSLCRTPSERYPVAAVLALLVATLIAMFTVYYGFLYSLIFLVLLGMFSSMTQMLQERETAQAAIPYARPVPSGIVPQSGYYVRPG